MQVLLEVSEAVEEDGGDYTCVVENSEGVGKAPRPALVTILTPPRVSLTMLPPSPIREGEKVPNTS